MPTYEYQTDDGEVHELFMTIAQMEKHQNAKGEIKLPDGRIGKRIFTSASTRSTQWALGHRSTAMGCCPEYAEQHEKELHAATGDTGIRVCRETGDCITYSQAQKVRCARAFGAVDLDGGYSS